MGRESARSMLFRRTRWTYCMMFQPGKQIGLFDGLDLFFF